MASAFKQFIRSTILGRRIFCFFFKKNSIFKRNGNPNAKYSVKLKFKKKHEISFKFGMIRTVCFLWYTSYENDNYEFHYVN